MDGTTPSYGNLMHVTANPGECLKSMTDGSNHWKRHTYLLEYIINK